MALGFKSRCLRAHLDCRSERKRAVEAVSSDGFGSRRCAWQAVLACRIRRRTAVDAASGDRPPKRRRPRSRRRRCPHLESHPLCRRRKGNVVLPLASTARRSLHSHLLAFCIDHTKERSSHRHKHCQLDDWGLGGCALAGSPTSNLLDTCWEKHCLPSQEVVIVIRALAHNGR